jgi:hypothetical protein
MGRIKPRDFDLAKRLAGHGVLSQIPYAMTFATTRRSKRMTINGREAEFRQIKKALFFGYRLEGGLLVAEPEKALLDELYMVARGRASIPMDELALDRLSKEKLKTYAERGQVLINVFQHTVGWPR